MRSCCCTNQCPGCGSCCQVACGCQRRGPKWWPSSPAVDPATVRPFDPSAPQPGQLPLGRTHREPLTEEDVRRIIRQELERQRRHLEKIRDYALRCLDGGRSSNVAIESVLALARDGLADGSR